MTRVGHYQMPSCSAGCTRVRAGALLRLQMGGRGVSRRLLLICAMTLPLGIPLCQNTGIEIQRAKNRHKARSVVYLCMALLNVAFTWVASPYLGYWAPAIAYIASISLGNGLFMNGTTTSGSGSTWAISWRRDPAHRARLGGGVRRLHGALWARARDKLGPVRLLGRRLHRPVCPGDVDLLLDDGERASIAAKSSLYLFLKRRHD